MTNAERSELENWIVDRAKRIIDSEETEQTTKEHILFMLADMCKFRFKEED